MPKTSQIRFSGVTYTLYSLEHEGVSPKQGSLDFIALKLFPPPRGADGDIRSLMVRSAPGTSTAPATPPTAKLFAFIDNDASPENGTTIFVPGYNATLTGAFTVPAADGVTLATATVGDTSSLHAGDPVYIGSGTTVGLFSISAITSATTFTCTNSGAVGNSAPATVIPVGSFVTRTPATGPIPGRWMQLTTLT
jgi:hypothetical protein